MTWSMPALTVLVGAIIVAIGTFWSASRQSSLNAELRSKNETIIALQADSISYMKGTLKIRFDVATNTDLVDGLLDIMVFKEDDNPAYDVVVRVRRDVDKAYLRVLPQDVYELGAVTSHLSNTKIRLPYGYYQIDVSTRAGNLTEMLHIAPAPENMTGLKTLFMYDVQSWDGSFKQHFSSFPK